MKSRLIRFTLFTILATLLSLLVACGGGAVAAADLPVYPAAVQLQTGEDPIADTLANNMAQDAAMRNSLGVGGKMEQMVFRLPENTSWDQVNNFFDAELKAAGWDSGLGGMAGSIAADAMASANAGNEMFQMGMWSKGQQNLTLTRMVDVSNTTQPYLILSLNTN
ncbi:MAG: hypothetical protein KDE51_04400 [Anaerolineales bacterium]|nr:hypothetical protein [Anaerolineales bacterium]